MDMCNNDILQKYKYYTLADNIQCENTMFMTGTTIWVVDINVLPGGIYRYELMNSDSSDFLNVSRTSANEIIDIFKENFDAIQEYDDECDRIEQVNKHTSSILKHLSSILFICLFLAILFFAIYYIWNSGADSAFMSVAVTIFVLLIEVFPLTLYLCAPEMIYRFYRNKLNQQKLYTAKQILTQYNLDKS